MAGTLSACPREESAFGEAGAAEPRATGARRLPGGPAGLTRLFQGAVVLHVSALGYALFHQVSAPSLIVLVSGLAVTLLVLGAPHLFASPRVVPAHTPRRPDPSAPIHDLSQEGQGSGVSPSPLPFIGEKIVLDRRSADLSVLAGAAARLNSLPAANAHPWGELMARVSHELRTPLNAVIGFSDVMQSELLGPVGHPRYREYARHIGECGRDLLKSAEDTLAITCLLDHDPRIEATTGVDLAAVVEEAWAFHSAPGSTHGLSLEAHIPEGLEVRIDKRPLRQILVNLFSEAVRRADARGTVGIVATRDGELAQIEVYLRGQPGAPRVGQASLPICLARALLELAGASLIEVDEPHSTWRAVTALKCTSNEDLFPEFSDAATLRQADLRSLEAACA
ncbi:HAMP domain-containing sensor histidine kinase [Hyphomicrobium sp. CS1GBMeth3]|uniref:sensor histidine kinase n=1 Tax=Hyphomicrobium sp. CS1GBMeth3 TaxID=1892845 RepID=UPI000930800D|nr:HAMP domain-containing sensor histidine kinase [Hyphomicrobium sp. CS1GBMeth3]